MNINAVIQPAGFVLPVSLQLFDMLMVEAGEKTASKHRITAVTLNFRDPNYSAERGGYHPVEIRLVHQGMNGAWTTPPILAMSATLTPSLRKSSISVGRRATSGTAVQGICPRLRRGRSTPCGSATS